MKKLFALLLLAVPLAFAGVPVQVSWDAPVASPAVTNFTLYVSTQLITNKATVSASVNVTNLTSAWASNLVYSTTYHFVATSREGANESPFSAELIYTTTNLPAPVFLRLGP